MPPSQRQLKVGEELRHLISDLFIKDDFYDPETREVIKITISEVRVSPDLHNATVYTIPFCAKNRDKTMESLQFLAPQIKNMIFKKIRLKRIPDLYFKLDETFDKTSKLEAIFNKPEVQRDLE